VEQKKPKNISEIDELKLIYYEVIRGGSYNPKAKLYIKHFSEEESFLVLQKRIELSGFYASEGIPNEEELLKRALDTGDWTQEKEDKILEIKFLISDNEKSLLNIIPQQRGGIEMIIEKKRKELHELKQERRAFLGRGIEDLVDDDVEDYLSFLSFYRDEKFSTKYTNTYEEFQNLEATDIARLSKLLNEDYLKFNEENIKKVACMPFFINKFSYAKEDNSRFIGKPISHWTHNQNLLFYFGSRNLNVLSNTKGSPPDLNLEATPQDIVKWYDISHITLLAKQNESIVE